MKQYTMTGTDLNVSSICLGASPFGSYVNEIDSYEQMDTYVENGGNFLDTARTYGEKHISERTVGKWLKARGNREQIVLATKGGQELGPPYRRTLNYAHLSTQIDESLRHLQTDYIDLYYLHIDDRSVPVEGVVELLDDKIKEGKIRYAGCSNWGADRIAAANEFAKRTKRNGFSVSEIEWSLATVNHPNEPGTNNIWMDAALYEFHRRTGLAVCAYSSQARGFFAKLDRFGESAISDALHKQYGGERNMEMLHRLQKLSRETGYSVTVLAVAYICHKKQDFFALPIISCRNLAQLQESLTAAMCELDETMIAYLEAGRYE